MLVVDDSIVFRTSLQVRLNEDIDIEVIACAVDAEDAMRYIEKLKPDVITLDVEMPKINGIEFLKQFIPKYPIPTVVVSSLPLNLLEALNAGAVDFLRKPTGGNAETLKKFFVELRAKVKIASRASVRLVPSALSPKVPQFGNEIIPRKDLVIAVGASTGGTEAIIQVIKDLPVTTPGIIIVQHMPPVFTNLYAERLNRICKMKAKEAVDKDRVVPGQIIVAAGEFHMTLKKDSIGYYIRSQAGERVSGHCPSVDALFESVAEVAGKNSIGVILTGMGADGARGITKMHHTGAVTFGQDKESCVVYGMPMEAFKAGGISRQLPLDRIGSEIIQYLSKLGNGAVDGNQNRKTYNSTKKY